MKSKRVYLSITDDSLGLYNIAGEVRLSEEKNHIKHVMNNFERYCELLENVAEAKLSNPAQYAETIHRAKIKASMMILDKISPESFIAEIGSCFEFLRNEFERPFRAQGQDLGVSQKTEIEIQSSLLSSLCNKASLCFEGKLLIYKLLGNKERLRDLISSSEEHLKEQGNSTRLLIEKLLGEKEIKSTNVLSDVEGFQTGSLFSVGPFIREDTLKLVHAAMPAENENKSSSALIPDISEYNQMKPAKIDELFLNKTKDLVSRLKEPFKNGSSIVECQAVQSSPEWFESRKNRLTCSKFGKVCQGSFSNPNLRNKIDEVLYPRNLEAVPAIKYGINNEPVARDLFKLMFPELAVRETGIFLNSATPWLGGSPDGVILLKEMVHQNIDLVFSKELILELENNLGKENAILEVKSPFSMRQCSTYREVFEKKDFYLKVNSEGQIALEKTHPYYYQIQGLLEIMNLNFAILAVYLENIQPPEQKLVCVEVQKDQGFIQTMFTTLNEFYFRFMLPEILYRKKASLADMLYLEVHDYEKARNLFS